MSNQANLFDTTSATSSPELVAGPTPSSSPTGRKKGRSGPGVVRASRSPQQEALMEFSMRDTYGPIFDGLSPSAGLQQSLANKLRARMGVTGSPEYALIWKHWDMPSGEPICALRASGHRNQDKGSTGWPTLMSVPTSEASHNSTSLQERTAYKNIMGWQTPKCPSGGGQAVRQTPGGGLRKLEDQVLQAGWSTPTTRDHKDGTEKSCENVPVNKLLGREVHASGTPPSGTNVSTERPEGFRLNPRFSLWLMGYPVEWASCGEQATQSSRKSRRNS